MLHNLANGLTTLGNGPDIAYLIAGSLMGMFIGVIPGLGGVVVLSMALAFIYHIDLAGTLCLFLGVQAAGFFSASTTSILLNAPAHPEAFAVTFDGFPMAQKGEAGRAMGISATSTCIGGLIGCVVLVAFIPLMNSLPTYFKPPEYVGLVAIALVLVATLGTDSTTKALMSVGIGLLLSSVGASSITEQYRYTFGSVALESGISLVALALGSFALPQMILLFGIGRSVADQDMLGRHVGETAPVQLGRGFGKQVIGGVVETFGHSLALIRAGLIGVLTGFVPGIGGFAANFLSYGVAQQVSRKREEFGTGIPEGIIAPEGSSLAKEAGALVPLIGLGIPGGVGGALFIAALTIKGLHPGYGFSSQDPSIVYEMAWIIALAGIIGTSCGLLAAPILARVTRVPGPLLVPLVMAITVVGAFVSTTEFFAVMEVLVFAIVGLILRRLRYSLASFAVALILGPTFETNVYLTRNVYKGWTFLELPFTDILFLIAIGILVLKTVQFHKAARIRSSEEETLGSKQPYSYPVLSVTAAFVIAGVGFAAACYAAVSWSSTSAILPEVGGGLAGLAGVVRFWGDWTRWRKARRASADVGEEMPNVGLRAEDAVTVVSGPRLLVDLGAGPDASLATAGGTVLAPTVRVRQADLAASTIEGDVASLVGTEDDIRPREWGRRGQFTREVVAIAWFGLLIVMVYLFGFPIGAPVFILAYGLTATKRFLVTGKARIIYSVIGAASVLGLIIGVFQVLHLTFTPVVNL